MRRFISVIITALIVSVLMFPVLLLSACGKSEFGVTGNTGRKMVITAKNAQKGAFVMPGQLEVVEGEQITMTSDLTAGSVRVEIIRAPEQGIDEMPETDSAPVMTANLRAADGASGTVPAGNYMLRAACLEKAAGTVVIEVDTAS